MSSNSSGRSYDDGVGWWAATAVEGSCDDGGVSSSSGGDVRNLLVFFQKNRDLTETKRKRPCKKDEWGNEENKLNDENRK